MVAEVVGACGRCGGGAVAGCYADDDDEDGDVDAEEAGPRAVLVRCLAEWFWQGRSYSHPIFSNFLTLALATTSTNARKAHQTVQAAWSLNALKPTLRPTMPEPLQST